MEEGGERWRREVRGEDGKEVWQGLVGRWKREGRFE